MNIQLYIGITLMLFLFSALIVEAYYEKQILGFDSKKQKTIYQYVALTSLLLFVIIATITIRTIIY